MDKETFLKALIGGIFGVISTLLTVYKEEIIGFFNPNGRFKGQWEGSGRDIVIPGLLEYRLPEEYEFIFDLKQRGKRVSGEFYLKSEPLKRRFKILQGTVDGEFLTAIYKHKDRHCASFGSLVFRIDGKAKSITGFFLGRQHEDVGFVFGNITLKYADGR
jgi:hypothetical protein